MRKTALFVMAALAPFGMAPAQDHPAPRGNRGSQFKVNAQVQTPRILAVRFHHDICPHCKQLKPRFEQLLERTLDASVLLITLDLSTPETQHQSALMVGALGIESVWTGDLSRIGTVTFLDASSQKVLGEFRADSGKTLDAALQAAMRITRGEP